MRRNETLIPIDELALYSGCDENSLLALSGLIRAIKPDELRVANFSPIFITGPHASGKSALSKQSLNGNNHRFFDTGPLLRSYHRIDDSSRPFHEWVDANEDDYGVTFTDDVLAGHISLAMQNEKAKAVIIGNRSIRGIDRISDLLGAVDRRIVYIDAPTELLHTRYQIREGLDISIDEFEKVLERDRRMGQLALMESADIVIQNDSDFESAALQLLEELKS